MLLISSFEIVADFQSEAFNGVGRNVQASDAFRHDGGSLERPRFGIRDYHLAFESGRRSSRIQSECFTPREKRPTAVGKGFGQLDRAVHRVDLPLRRLGVAILATVRTLDSFGLLQRHIGGSGELNI